MQAMKEHVLVGGHFDGRRCQIPNDSPSIRLPIQTEAMASAVNFPSVQSTAPRPKVAEYTRRRIHGEGGPLEFFGAIELTDRQAIVRLIEHYGPR